MAEPEIIEHFLALGWRETIDQFKQEAQAIYSPRAFTAGLRDCQCNDKPPAVVIHCWPAIIPHRTRSYEVTITGEVRGIWLRLNAYSLTTLEEVEAAIEMLKRGWSAAAP